MPEHLILHFNQQSSELVTSVRGSYNKKMLKKLKISDYEVLSTIGVGTEIKMQGPSGGSVS
jgi:hypothetical protein